MRITLSKINGIILLSICLAMALTAFDAACAQEPAGTRTIVVVGAARVHGSNVSSARQEAISNSLVSAVARIVEDLLQVNSLTDNFAQLNKVLFDRTNTFVQDYKVLTEAAHGKSYRVVVQATVLGEKISIQLAETGILRSQTTLPRVLLLVAEQNVTQSMPRYWWGTQDAYFVSVCETVMAEHLTDAGFDVLDHRGAREKPLVNWPDFAKPDLTDQEAAALGAALKADVVVLATAVSSPSTNIMGSSMKSFNGAISGRVVRTDSAETMFNFSQSAVAVNENDFIGGKKALSDVGALAGGALAEQLTAVWLKQAGRPSVVEVSILGTGHLASYVKFRKALNTITGVEGIRVKQIQPNEATLLVEYKGKPKDLASALMLQNFKSFGIKITEVTDDSLRIELVKS